nr:TPA_asm: cytochrome c oxidase subunit II [Pseudomyrmex dendroicus]
MNTWLMGLQNSNSPVYDMMIFFHDFTMMILTFITMLIFLIMMSFWVNKMTNRYLIESNLIEITWTIMPMITLIFIAIPSIKILYLTDEMMMNNLTIKTLGHQWFWSYEYSDINNIEFDSFMLSYNSNENFRLLDVDNRCVIPFNYPVRILTSSTDVIHSWTVPSLGIKMDSTPGRLNQSLIWMNRPGLFFGQCSEICGINHSFMPIVIESTNLKNFKNWVFSFKP